MDNYRKSSFCKWALCVEVSFQTSSYCGSGACVGVAVSPDIVLVRDSKNPDREPLAFDAEEWQAFIQGVKAGEFDG